MFLTEADRSCFAYFQYSVLIHGNEYAFKRLNERLGVAVLAFVRITGNEYYSEEYAKTPFQHCVFQQ